MSNLTLERIITTDNSLPSRTEASVSEAQSELGDTHVTLFALARILGSLGGGRCTHHETLKTRSNKCVHLTCLE